MKRALAVVLTAVGTTVLLGATAASPAAAHHEPTHFCDVKDQPDATFDGQTISVNLRTEVVCFDKPVVVG